MSSALYPMLASISPCTRPAKMPSCHTTVRIAPFLKGSLANAEQVYNMHVTWAVCVCAAHTELDPNSSQDTVFV